MNKWDMQLIKQKMENVITETWELSFQEVESITTGCEKDILIFRPLPYFGLYLDFATVRH